MITAALVSLLMTAAAGAASARHVLDVKADRIVVLKSKRTLFLMRDGVVLRTYPIALGRHPIGTKHFRGDGRTPEGVFVIDGRNARSAYHLALHISYPDPAVLAQSVAAHADPGGDILIHGLPNQYDGPKNPSRFDKDWTEGCISVGDAAIEEIWRAVDDGTPIEIRP
jgi:murein L,D-transpeptidase YafK